MKKQLGLTLSVILTLGLWVPAIFAQASGSVKGVCKDAEGKPTAPAIGFPSASLQTPFTEPEAWAKIAGTHNPRVRMTDRVNPNCFFIRSEERRVGKESRSQNKTKHTTK